MRCSASLNCRNNHLLLSWLDTSAREAWLLAPPAMTSQSRHERAFSDRAQAMSAGAPPRPGMGDRTSSAPPGDLYKLDNGRRPSVGTKSGQTLVEEDEGLSGMSASTGALRQSRSRHGDEVRVEDPRKIPGELFIQIALGETFWESAQMNHLVTNCSSL